MRRSRLTRVEPLAHGTETVFVDVLRNLKNKKEKEKYPDSRNGHGKLSVSIHGVDNNE